MRAVDLSPEQWAWAKASAEAGNSARSIARRLGVHPSKVTRAAERGDWVAAWRTGSAPGGAVAPPEAPGSGHTGEGPRGAEIDQEGVEIGPRGPIPWAPAPAGQGAPAGRRLPSPGVPDDERAARLWHCRRCGLSGFDPNRRGREWHTDEVCDGRLRRLDAGFAAVERERPVWAMPW